VKKIVLRGQDANCLNEQLKGETEEKPKAAKNEKQKNRKENRTKKDSDKQEL